MGDKRKALVCLAVLVATLAYTKLGHQRLHANSTDCGPCPGGSCCDKPSGIDVNGVPARPSVAQGARNYNGCSKIPFCGWCTAKSVCMDERNTTGCPAFG